MKSSAWFNVKNKHGVYIMCFDENDGNANLEYIKIWLTIFTDIQQYLPVNIALSFNNEGLKNA